MATATGTARRISFGFWPVVRVSRAVMLTTLAGAAAAAIAPAALGWTPTVVVSGSMRPAIHPGDIVVTSPLRPSDTAALRPGSIVLAVDPARHDGRLLLHRVIAHRPDGTLVTQGDANSEPDSTVMPPGHVRGIARFRVPLIGIPVWQARQGNQLPALGLLGLVVTMLAARPYGRRPTQRPSSA